MSWPFTISLDISSCHRNCHCWRCELIIYCYYLVCLYYLFSLLVNQNIDSQNFQSSVSVLLWSNMLHSYPFSLLTSIVTTLIQAYFKSVWSFTDLCSHFTFFETNLKILTLAKNLEVKLEPYKLYHKWCQNCGKPIPKYWVQNWRNIYWPLGTMQGNTCLSKLEM